MSRYRHLSIQEREKILVMRGNNKGVRSIARALGRQASTVSRELRQHENPKGYSAQSAQKAYEKNKAKCGRKPKLLQQPKLKAQVEGMLKLYCSPEQIENRLKLEGAEAVSLATIYRAIQSGVLEKSLKACLRFKGRPYRKGHGGRTGRIPVEHSIHERPREANERLAIGHWESDTVRGMGNIGCIATHVDRKSRYLISVKMPNRTAQAYMDATLNAFAKIPRCKRKTFTTDHGKEFAGYKRLKEELDVEFYFADPGSPGQRGSNEHTNGLLRQFCPKRTSLKGLTQKQLDFYVWLINLRPRKCLGWRAPFEVFHSQLLHLI